mmetsp:Transcript_10936/g.15342  ORF Transcript_10936/g.15342 Transcript_10936/m.15342 type:complete len:223 (-) Transcript_10936:208-876(-)
MYEVHGVARIIGSSESLLKRHYRITRFLASNLTNLSKHKVFDVWPVHSKINNVSLNVHTSTTGATLHLLSNEGAKIITHITTEDAGTEWHVHTIRKSCIRKYNSQSTLLGKHLYLAAIARETNFICVNGNSATKPTNKCMIDINAFARFFHISNDVFHFVVVQALSGWGKDILVMRLSCIFGNKRFICKAGLSILFLFCGVFTISFSCCNLSHLSFVTSSFN